MRRDMINWIRDMALFIGVLMLCGGCSAALYTQPTYESDDMYGVQSQEKIIERQAQQREAQQQLRKQRERQWAQILGYDMTQPSETIVNTKGYQTPYGERLLALSAAEYQRPSSYYELSRSAQVLSELSEYDPSMYNATVDAEGQVRISPKYVNSFYGVWDAPYFASWVYGYPRYGYPRYGYPSYAYPYYAQPLYGYMNYGWGYGYYTPYYDPWWGYASRPYAHWYYGGAYGSSYGGGGKRMIVRRADPYVAPSVSVGGGSSSSKRGGGSSVGTTNGRYYNRGVTTPSSYQQSIPSRSTQPTISAPSVGSGSVNTNSIGR